MENKAGAIDITTDIIIPAIIVVILFLINGIVLYIIFKKRKTIVYEEYNEAMAPEEPTTSQPLQKCSATSGIEAGNIEEEGIEMERL